MVQPEARSMDRIAHGCIRPVGTPRRFARRPDQGPDPGSDGRERGTGEQSCPAARHRPRSGTMATSTADQGSTGAGDFRDLTAVRPGAVAGDRARTVFGQVMGLAAVTVGFAALGAYLGRNLSGGTGILCSSSASPASSGSSSPRLEGASSLRFRSETQATLPVARFGVRTLSRTIRRAPIYEMNAMDDRRDSKLHELHKRIANNEYVVDARVVADAIVRRRWSVVVPSRPAPASSIASPERTPAGVHVARAGADTETQVLAA
jgi:anti-sigma28 factor (negative regulator of flagellin synthesis)